MKPIDIYIRYSDQNVTLEKIATLNMENNLIYKDEGNYFKAQIVNIIKFTSLTLASPLISIARLIRSLAFVCSGDPNRAGREFVGSLTTPILTSICLAGSILSSVVYILSCKKISFYVQMRRTYAYFEAWLNKINLKDPNLLSYSQRASNPTDFLNHVWTTAPCMHPILEKAESPRGGLLDVDRMRKIFPLIRINGMRQENGKIVIQSEYSNEAIYYDTCNGACVHAKVSQTCCCCYRIEATFSRLLCCEIGQGNCRSITNSRDSCGISFCRVCCCSICCCHTKVNHVETNECCLVSA